MDNYNEAVSATFSRIGKQLDRIESTVRSFANRPIEQIERIEAYSPSLFTNGYSVTIEETNPVCIRVSTRMPHAKHGHIFATIDECIRLSELLENAVSGKVAFEDGVMSNDLTADTIRVYSLDHGARIDYIDESNHAWFGFSSSLALAYELRHAAQVSRLLEVEMGCDDDSTLS